MTPTQFIARWRKADLTERSASQQHFLDLCALVEHPTPVEADPEGKWFTFERGAVKHGGGDGWADVWKRGFFGWEYKGKRKDLDRAYDQLLLYRSDLENPPLLVVCDLDRIVIHTNFTATRHMVHEIRLRDLGEARNLEILRAVFHSPERLRPGTTSEAITQDAARRVAEIAQTLRGRGLDPRQVAHFLDRLVFCLFAEDIRLLPEMVFTRLVDHGRQDPVLFSRLVSDLFAKMATGGYFGVEPIRHFNGSLFDSELVLELTAEELNALHQACALDWSAVDPSIFGTLFERGLDPTKRSQLGAHYTSRTDIETLVQPVVLQPLRMEWEAVRAAVEKKGASRIGRERLLHAFLQRLAHVRVLDPACGSGNFLYVTLQLLKDLEKEVIVYGMDQGFPAFLPEVGPWQLYGIEVNPYAFDLAQMTVWIGYLQWIRANGFGVNQEPILRKLGENFRCMDAVLDLTDPTHPSEPEWPEVDFIVGNPPFLGNKLMRSQLGADYCSTLWKLYQDRIPAMSDLCCYWFEKARAQITTGKCKSAGLLATTGIKQAGARRVLERIGETGQIFFAISDREWVLEGAAVRISMVGFGLPGCRPSTALDGRQVPYINPDLTSGVDLTQKRTLASNLGLCFMGTTKVGAFDIDEATAIEYLRATNPDGRPNSDVLRPYRNGSDLVQNCSNRWIIDFGVSTSVDEAALYEAPFEHLVTHVRAKRENNARRTRAERWWLLGETLPAFRRATMSSRRYVGTPRVSKHRVFVWLDSVVLPDSKVLAIAMESDCDFGLLHSRVHAVWTLGTSSLHGGERPTYNPTLSFETFPFPEATPDEQAAITAAAADLDQLRSNWLNPPEWTCEEVLEFPGSAKGPWARFVQDPNDWGVGTVRYARRVPRDGEQAGQLATRTLTKLYNTPPTWLQNAHRKLDEAVFAAFGWETSVTDQEILARLLALNLKRASGVTPDAL